MLKKKKKKRGIISKMAQNFKCLQTTEKLKIKRKGRNFKS